MTSGNEHHIVCIILHPRSDTAPLTAKPWALWIVYSCHLQGKLSSFRMPRCIVMKTTQFLYPLCRVVCLMPIVRMSHAGLPYPSFVNIYTLQQADST